MTSIIDRRKNGNNKTTGNRQKFIRRAHGQIKKAVKEAVKNRKVENIASNESDDNTITIPSKDLKEPHFKHGNGGNRKYVIPGNHDKVVGDIIPKPKSGRGGGGTDGSDSGEGEDDFAFTLTREEFLDFFFEDLELPDLVKTQLKDLDNYKLKRAGYTTVGMPSNLNIIRSMRNALGRQIALQSPFKKELDEIKKKLENCSDDDEKEKLLARIEFLEKKIKAVPFIDDIDIRYNSFEKRPNPTTQAVMFCLMDVSGSMGEVEKELAKRFFMLLYVFLQRHYEKIDLVFIRHHTTARECTEHEFFYDKESGGTVVSSALEKMAEIIKNRYNSADWNIYGAQASDGDNWNGDDETCLSLMNTKIMPFVQYFAYVQVGRDDQYDIWHQFEGDKPLWQTYVKLKTKYKNFAMDQIDSPKDIYPVFRELFKKKE